MCGDSTAGTEPQHDAQGSVARVHQYVCMCMGGGGGCVCVCVCIYVCVLEVVALSQQHYLCSQLVLLLLGVPNLATG